MNRVMAFRLALLALPAPVRHELGAELEGTLLDAEQDAAASTGQRPASAFSAASSRRCR